MEAQSVLPPPPPPKDNKKAWTIVGIIGGVLACCLCIALVAAILYFGFRDGGFLAGGGSAVGTWNFSYDWNCDGDSRTGTFYIYDDRTFSDSQGGSGSWAYTSGELNLIYPGGTTYTGRLNGNTISGTMVDADGDEGCWEGTRELP
ncbi:MAG: hypothetical protein JXB85_08565 [Anaerolineales bacterium]|nr:hypothetical protein [Anaerolineales bacterium]